MKLFDEYPFLENENIAIHRLGPGDAEGLARLWAVRPDRSAINDTKGDSR